MAARGSLRLIVLLAFLVPAHATQDQHDNRVAQLEARVQAAAERIARLERAADAASARIPDADRAAQLRAQIRAVLTERDFAQSLVPATVSAGYDNGFFIRDATGAFSLLVNGQLQLRWTHYATRADNRWLAPRLQRNDRTGFDLQRARVAFTGAAYHPDLTYNLTVRADAPDSGDVSILYGWVNYRISDAFQLRAGVFRLASTRIQFQSDLNFNFVDRPMTDAVFGLGIGTAVRVWGELLDKRLAYYVDVANALGTPENRTISPDPADMDSNPAILARVVWRALGEQPGKDFAVDPDLPRHVQPALEFGAHYAFNADQADTRTLRIPYPLPRGNGRGGFGLTTSNGLQLHQFGVDAGFKLQGLSLIGEYILRLLDVRRADRSPYTPLWQLTGDASTNAQHGAYVQAGWFLPIPGLEDKLEAVARVGGISATSGGREGTWEYTGGFNYYLAGPRTKLQFDVTKVTEVPISNSYSSLATVNDDALVFRAQVQVSY